MKYFKNTDLAKLYHVSEKSVRNWIDAAEEEKLDLQLYSSNGRNHIANTDHNTTIIAELVEKGKKYKNTRGHRIIVPKDKFYSLYNQKQILDIISNIDIHREIPLQYTYFNSGAERWDKYTQNLLQQKASNYLTNIIQLLRLNFDYLDELLADYDKVNVIDIGVGNALPIRDTLQHLLDSEKLNRYIAIDISKEMLDIAESNIERWFGDKVKFEGYIRDINYDRFNDLLVADTFGDSAETVINLVLFLGGTISNFREPQHVFATVHESMGRRDLLLFSKKPDTEKSRRYFEMTATGNQDLELVLRLLNLEPSMYVLEQFFDEQRMARVLQAKLTMSLSIRFNLNGQERMLHLHKGESLLLWRARHQSTVEIIQEFDQNDFDLQHVSRSKDQAHLMIVSRIKTRQEYDVAD
jgi:uncharacterized SAM-dependent methyltransferase